MAVISLCWELARLWDMKYCNIKPKLLLEVLRWSLKGGAAGNRMMLVLAPPQQRAASWPNTELPNKRTNHSHIRYIIIGEGEQLLRILVILAHTSPKSHLAPPP